MAEKEPSEAPSGAFMKLRGELQEIVREEMEGVVQSMEKLDRSLGRLNESRGEFASTSRIWQSFYDPSVIERFYKGSEA